MKIPIQPMKLTLMITLAIATFINNYAPVRTQPVRQISGNPPPPPTTGTPQTPQRRGGTRPGDSKCPVSQIDPIAFMPKSGQFVLESPTFWFYIPFAPKDVDSISFVILNAEGEYIQPPKKIPLSGTPGFISLGLPSTSPPLEIGKRYRWSFSIYCDRQNQEDRISRDGIFQKIAPNFTTGTPGERITRYVENGSWYDALNLLGELRRRESTNTALKADWDKLFASLDKLDPTFKFSAIADRPIASCCSLEQ